MRPIGKVHFGGPDRPPGLLRDLLAERIAAVPAGGAIDWVTYYFRDRRLAAELVAAQRRKVDVCVTLEGYPRTPHANNAVIAILEEGLKDGLRVIRHRTDGKPWGNWMRPRLHEKLYCFSHPKPVALVGSFNPSGDEPEEAPEVIREIGDHDRGHNLLVELQDPKLVAALVDHARHLHTARHLHLSRFSVAANRDLVCDPLTICFWPRVLPHPIHRWLSRLDSRSHVRLAASHISGNSANRTLLGLARRGVDLEILTEATHRRVPPAMERSLGEAGIRIRRVVYDEWIPMHSKFVLVEGGGEQSVIFGSFNWSEHSHRLNRELGVIARDKDLFGIFAERWETLSKAADSGREADDKVVDEDTPRSQAT